MVNDPRPLGRVSYVLHKFDARPFEALICLMCVLAAGPILVLGGRPESIDKFLPEILVRIWGINLILGAAMVLFGGIVGDRVLFHKAGLNLVGSACLVYGAAIIAVTGVAGVIAAIILLAIGVACVRRAFTLERYLVVWNDTFAERLAKSPLGKRK